jgi:hypothetical protein
VFLDSGPAPSGHPGMTMQKEIGEPILTADSITLAFGGITR